MEAKMQLNDTVNVLKEKTIKEELYVQQNYTLKIKERLRHFQINKNWGDSLPADMP